MGHNVHLSSEIAKHLRGFAPLAVLILMSASLGSALTTTQAGAVDVLGVCTVTDLMRDGHFLTAKRINPPVLANEEVDAANVVGPPCEIAVYYNVPANYSISNSLIHNAVYFGVAVRGAGVNVDVFDSSVHDIGDTPQGGAQHGVAIAYVEGATGTVARAQVYKYQKNGFAADGAGTRVDISDSRFRGAGPIPYNAQNGVQFSRGGIGSVTATTMEEHEYTGCSQQDSQQTGCTPFVAAGLLIFDSPARSIDRKHNLYRENDFNVLNIQSPGP